MKMCNLIRRSLAILMTLAVLMSIVPIMGVSAATADDGVDVLVPVYGDVQGGGNMVTSESTAPYGPIALVNNGKFVFTLISADKYSETVLYFADAVNKRTDAKVTIGKSGSSSTYEMIIGKYDARSESCDIYTELTHYRSDHASDYIVRLVGTKLYVVATTNYALQKALDYVLDTYIKDDQGKIPADLNVKVRPHHYFRDTKGDGSYQEFKIAGHKISEYVIRTERYPSLLVQRAANAIQEFFMENYGVVLPIKEVNSEGTNVGIYGPEIRVGPMNGAVNMIRPEYTSFTQDDWQDHITIETDGLIPGDYGYYEMNWDGDHIQLNGGSVYAISAAAVRFMQLFEDQIKSESTTMNPSATFSGNYKSGFDYLYGRGYETVDFSLIDGLGLVYTDEFDYVGSDAKIYETIRSKWTLSQDKAYPTGPITNNGTVQAEENYFLTPADYSDYGVNFWVAADTVGNNYLFEVAKAHNKKLVANIGGTEYTFYEGVRLQSMDKWGFRYGVWETRIIMGTHNGSCSAVWSHTREPYDNELYYHEIDVYENFGQDAFVPSFIAFDGTLTTGNYQPNTAVGEEYNRILTMGQLDELIPSEDGTSKGGTNYQSACWELPAEGEHFYDTFHHLAVDWTYDYLRICLDGEIVSRVILKEDGPTVDNGKYRNMYDAYRAGQTIKLANGVGKRYYCKTSPAGEPLSNIAYIPSYFLDDISTFFEVQIVDYTRVYQTDNAFINYEPAQNDIRFSDNFLWNDTNAHRLGKFNGAQSFENYDEGEELAEGIVATEEKWLGGYTSAKVNAVGDTVRLPLVNGLGEPFAVCEGNDYIVSLNVCVPESEAEYDLQYRLSTAEGVVADTQTVATTERGGWQKIEIIVKDCAYSGDLLLDIGVTTDGAYTFYIDDVYVELQPESSPADAQAMNFENYDVGTVLMQNNPGDGSHRNNEGSSVVVSDKRSYTGDKSARFVADAGSMNAYAQMNVLDTNGNNVQLEKGKTYWLSYKVYIEKQYYNRYDSGSDRAIREDMFNFYAACVPDDKVSTFFGSSYKVDMTANIAYREGGNLPNNRSEPGTAHPDHQTRNEWFEVSVKIDDCPVEGNLRLGISHYSEAKFVCYVDDVRVYEGDQLVTVRFDTNGGKGTYANLTLERGESLTAAIKAAGFNEPTREHYIFRGWHTDADFAAGTYINFKKTDDSKENRALGYNGDMVTLYARWQGAEHTFDGCDDMICNDCGMVIEDGGHIYDNTCDVDCNVCGDVREVAGHAYDNDRDLDCNFCGEIREVAPAKNGWVEEGGKWAYYVDDVKLVNRWQKDSNGWCYLGEDGYMLTNAWVKDSVGWCYVGANGYCVTNQWKKDSKGWCYLNASGRMVANGWVKDGGKWYFLDKNGYMVANQWRKDSKGWVYLGSSGAMLTNAWCTDSQGWCYVGADGYAVTNTWKRDSVGWCYLNANGSMTKSAWVKDGGKWYYLDASGYMLANTSRYIGNKTYRFNASGVCTNP